MGPYSIFETNNFGKISEHLKTLRISQKTSYILDEPDVNKYRATFRSTLRYAAGEIKPLRNSIFNDVCRSAFQIQMGTSRLGVIYPEMCLLILRI